MAKFFLAIGLLLISVITKNVQLQLIISILMIFSTVFIAKIPFKSYIFILTLPLSFLTLSVLGILISISTSNIDYLWHINIFNFYLGISKTTILTARHLIFRSFSALTCTYFLVLTTPMNDILLVFKKLKLPTIFIEMSILIYRFIFIFLEEAKEIHIAQELRFGYSNLKNGYKSISTLIVSLFIRVFLKYEHMKSALASKGFDNKFHI